MLDLFETRPDCHVQESEYQRLLGYPRRHNLEGRAREIAEATRQWYAEHGRPWIYARQTDALELSGSQVKINGSGFSSSPLLEQFQTAQVHSAVLVAVSAGPECEERARVLWQDGKPDEYFFMEMFGSAVVEHLVAIANGRLCGWADENGMVALPHYSPGYSGWDVADQTKLWQLLQQTAAGKIGAPIDGAHLDTAPTPVSDSLAPRSGERASLPTIALAAVGERGSFNPTGSVSICGQLEVMESGMLRPKKSLLAVVGLTRHLEKARAYAKLVPCENCSLPGCQYRRAPYDHFPPQIEGVGRLQPGSAEDSSPSNGEAGGLNHHAKYSINGKALRRWSQERLQLSSLPDGSVEARFRYEGTTCSNMGRLLEFDYFVLLTPGHDRYRIVEASCLPAPGDTGHTFQCEYLKDAASFMRAIADEKPLLGRPLNDVFAWERAYSPSGCFCEADRRTHKWGLIFEVIHYALVEREKTATNPRADASGLSQILA